jgi:hypothetical protein
LSSARIRIAIAISREVAREQVGIGLRSVLVGRIGKVRHQVAGRVLLPLADIFVEAVLEEHQRVRADLVRGVAFQLARRRADQFEQLGAVFLGHTEDVADRVSGGGMGIVGNDVAFALFDEAVDQRVGEAIEILLVGLEPLVGEQAAQ